MGKHTIVLIQETRSKNTRSFYDYETVTAAIDGIKSIYESKLQQANPRAQVQRYDLADLNNYVDSLGDISCLVFSEDKMAYEPYDREWIKKRIYKHIKRVASASRR